MSTTKPGGGGRTTSAHDAAIFTASRAFPTRVSVGGSRRARHDVVPEGRRWDEVTTRRASTDDFAAILELARAALGWSDGDAAFLEWKHRQNPFGESPMWVAEADGRVVGFRAFMRWELTTPDGDALSAARAVDTATDPEFQGRGIFAALDPGCAR